MAVALGKLEVFDEADVVETRATELAKEEDFLAAVTVAVFEDSLMVTWFRPSTDLLGEIEPLAAVLTADSAVCGDGGGGGGPTEETRVLSAEDRTCVVFILVDTRGKV